MTTPGTCLSPVSLTRAYFEGADRGTDEHREQCESCAADADSLDRLIELGKQLPEATPSTDRVNAVFNSLMTSTATSTNSRRSAPRAAWFYAAVAASVALGLSIYLLSNTSEPVSTPPQEEIVRRASVQSQQGTDHVILGSQPDEIVRLAEGVISVKVEPLRKGERFRVVTGDAEVEVRGTSFDVEVEDDSLISVNVTSGRVEVRPVGQATVILGPGERWTRPEPASEPTVATETDDPIDDSAAVAAIAEPEPETVAPVRRVHRKKARRPIPFVEPETEMEPNDDTPQSEPIERIAPVKRAGPAETAFTAGWEELVNGNPSAAAAHFDDAVSKGGNHPIVEDASFWRAVANDRKGAKKRATTLLRRFLKEYPRSSRAGEASCMLGWKLLESGDLDQAEKLFEKASKGRAQRIKNSAQKGLAEIDARR